MQQRKAVRENCQSPESSEEVIVVHRTLWFSLCIGLIVTASTIALVLPGIRRHWQLTSIMHQRMRASPERADQIRRAPGYPKYSRTEVISAGLLSVTVNGLVAFTAASERRVTFVMSLYFFDVLFAVSGVIIAWALFIAALWLLAISSLFRVYDATSTSLVGDLPTFIGVAAGLWGATKYARSLDKTSTT